MLYGSARGLSPAGNQFWHQDRGGIADAAEDGDAFGQSLAAGDFNHDGFVDLAVGVPGEGLGMINGAGAVNVLNGTAAGLSATGNQFWHQDRAGIADAAEFGDGFGWSVAAGDFNGDGFADLAVGVLGEDLGDIQDAGAVNVLYGSAGGLSVAGNQFWNQDSPGIADVAESFDQFGEVLGVGDFNGDGFADLVIGVPLETLGAVRRAGAVNVLYGSAGRLTPAGNQFWHQDRGGIADLAEADDFLGFSLAK